MDDTQYEGDEVRVQTRDNSEDRSCLGRLRTFGAHLAHSLIVLSHSSRL